MMVMRRVMVTAAAAAAMAIGSPPAWAVHFRIELTVQSTRGAVEAPTDPYDRPGTGRPTPVMDVKHGEPLVFQFVMTCLYPHGIRKNTGVHYWIRRQADDVTPQTIDESAPLENKDPEATADDKTLPLDGHFLVSCKLNDKVGLRQKLRLHDPGTYLLRVQSEHSSSDHEHFSQMILHVH